jgi:AraC-like DNA-binding protein
MTSVTVTPRAPVSFTTVGLPDEERVELWESHNAQALIGLRCRTLTSTVLDASEINVQLDRLHLARVRGSSHVVERDQELIRRHPSDAVSLFFNLAGEAFFYHDDGVRTLQPGQLLLCDADRPFMRGFSHGLEELVVKVPRPVFAEATGIEEVERPLVMNFAANGANSFAETLARQVGAAARAENPYAADEQTLVELLGALTGQRLDGHSTAHRAAAQVYIDRHLREPALCATQVAAGVGISTRHLSRVFAEAGTSVPKHMLNRRLDAAQAMLLKPAASSLTIAEVAHHCGFTSAAHFSSAFTARYGERPTDVRRRAVASRAFRVGSGDIGSRIGHTSRFPPR